MVRPIDLQTIFMQEPYAAQEASKKRRAVESAKRHRQRRARFEHRYFVRKTSPSDDKTGTERGRGKHIDAYA